MATYQYLDSTQADGTILGQSATAKISCYGVTPVVQASVIAAATAGDTVGGAISATVNSILTALKNFGIVATA